ncbi:MAG: right-handed parallel beta-helix repeat-containing protein [Kiritimatiellae bacterium]|nr:right-handed parallel beta-helix repeat-containing protein [Kiritimatiellia bacterium]
MAVTFRSKELACACGAALAVAAGLGLPPKLEGATYYFSTAGNDADPGTSSGAPKQSIFTAAAFMTAGNTIRLKRGDTWYIGTSKWRIAGKNGTASAPIVVEDYGSGPKPVISASILLDSGWVNVGANRWSHAHAAHALYACFKDGMRLKLVGALAEVTASHLFYKDAATLCVYSADNPGSRHVVEICAGGKGLFLEDASHIAFRNIDFRGGGGGGTVQLYAPTSFAALDGCRISRCNAYGLYFAGAGGVHADLTVEGCELDKVWHAYLNSTSEPGGDGMHTAAPLRRARIRANRITNFGHTCMKLYQMTDSTVELNETFAGESNYLRSLAMYNSTCARNIVRRNNFHDMHIGSKCGGEANKYYSNLISFCSPGQPSIKSSQALGVSLGFGGDAGAANGNYWVNNTFYDMAQHAIEVICPELDRNYFYNNLVAKVGAGIAFSTRKDTTVDQVVERNCFWNRTGSEALIYYKDRSYTVAGADAALSTWRDNLQVDPQLTDPANRDFRLRAGSPCRAGGRNVAALMGAGFVDFDGNPWDAASPSIGAFQYRAADAAPPAAPRGLAVGWAGP